MPRTAIVFYCGFREEIDKPTGTGWLHDECLRRFADKDTHVFELHTWKSDAPALAGHIVRRGYSRIIVVGYSWGGGYATQRFARAIAKHGMSIDLMLLCDAVYRPLWLPTWLPANVLAARAMLPGSAVIRIPANVRRVVSVWQDISRPAGHVLEPECQATHVWSLKLDYPHTRIDEAPEWHRLVLDWIQQTLTN